MPGRTARASAQTAVHIRLAFTREGRMDRASLPRHVCHSHLNSNRIARQNG